MEHSPAYRVYFFDDADHIVKAVVVDAENDMDATTKATALMDGHDMEIWDGSRLVARLPHSA
jgi:hypothetical protein